MFYIVSRSRCVKVEIVEVSRIALGSRFDYVQNCCQHVCTQKYDDGGGETLFSFFIIGGARPGHLSAGRKNGPVQLWHVPAQAGKVGEYTRSTYLGENSGQRPYFPMSVLTLRLGMMMTKLQLDH